MDKQLEEELNNLGNAVVKAVVTIAQTRDMEDARVIRDELRRLPGPLMTEVLNNVILNLVKIDPDLCRWFLLEVFLGEADPEGKADVAERINILMADLRSQ
jgi:hypothetical protein